MASHSGWKFEPALCGSMRRASRSAWTDSVSSLPPYEASSGAMIAVSLKAAALRLLASPCGPAWSLLPSCQLGYASSIRDICGTQF